MFRVKLLLIELLRLVHALLPAQYLQLLLPQSSLHLLHRRVPFPRPLVFLRAVRVQFGFEVGEVAMPLQVRDVEILQALLQAFVLVHVRRADGLERGQALLRALELGASFLDLSLEAVLVLVEIGQRSPHVLHVLAHRDNLLVHLLFDILDVHVAVDGAKARVSKLLLLPERVVHLRAPSRDLARQLTRQFHVERLRAGRVDDIWGFVLGVVRLRGGLVQ